MTKEELLHFTLKQLTESLKTTPENFRYEDGGATTSTTNNSFPGPAIIWQFRVKLSEDNYIPDPLNNVKTIIVTFNKLGNQLQCYIYNREVNSLNYMMTPEATATASYNDFISPYFYRTFRQFSKIRRDLLKSKENKEYIDYMNKLNKIFPATHEDDLFK